jgi:hypothetical protein
MRRGRTMLPTRLQRYNYFSEQQSHCNIFFETVLFARTSKREYLQTNMHKELTNGIFLAIFA